MLRKILTIGILSMILLVSFTSFSTIAKDIKKQTQSAQNVKEEQPLDSRIIIRGGIGLKIRAIDLTPQIGDYVKVEYNYRRKGYDYDTYSVVGTYIRITNFQFDKGTYTVTARIGGQTETKSGFFFLCLFL